MVPLPLLAGLQATPLHTHTQKLLKILDTLNNPFSLNRNVLFLWCLLAMSVCILFPQPLLSELGMMSPVWSVGSSTSQLQTVTLHFTTSDIKKSLLCSFKAGPVCVSACDCVSYLEAGVGPWMAKVVEPPRLRRGVHRFPLEVRGHTISPRKLEYAHGDRTLLPGYVDKRKEGWFKRKKSTSERTIERKWAGWSSRSYIIRI